MKTDILPLALFALSVSAVDNKLPASGNFRPGPGSTDSETRIFEEKGRQPEDTRSITFNHTLNNTSEQWTWRINISSVAIPNDLKDLNVMNANASEKLQVANTQYQLLWPGASNESIQAYLRTHEVNAVIQPMIMRFPSNITDGFDLGDHSGDCAPVLGEQCIKSIKERANEWRGFYQAVGCENTLSAGSLQGTDDAAGDIRMEVYRGSDTRETYRNDTLFYHTSRAYQEGNGTELMNAKSSVHMLLMTFSSSEDTPEKGPESLLFCQMITKSPDPASAAVEWRGSMMVVWAAVILSVVGVMW